MIPENPTIPVLSVVVCPFCAAKDAEIARLKAESEGRRKELLKVGEERNSEWTRAEAAEELRVTLAEGKEPEVVVKVPAEKEHVDE